jgi:hypothetical protein
MATETLRHGPAGLREAVVTPANIGLRLTVPKTKLLTIGLVRQPSLKSDNLLKGTLWIDSASLSNIAHSCAAEPDRALQTWVVNNALKVSGLWSWNDASPP